MYKKGHSSLTYKSQKLGTTQIHQYYNEKIGVYSYTEILYSNVYVDLTNTFLSKRGPTRECLLYDAFYIKLKN